MSLDVPTVMLALVVGFLLLALQLWVAQRGGVRLPELQLWSQGCWAVLVGFVFLPLRVVLPMWISVFVGNGMLMIGLSLYNAAVHRHLVGGRAPGWYWWLCGIALAVMTATVQMDISPRTGLYSLIYGVLLLPSIYLLLRFGWPRGGTIRMVAVTLSGTALSMLLRAAHAAVRPEAYTDLLNANPANAIAYLMAFMCLMGAGFGFVLACFERVALRMEELATTDGLTGCINRSTTDALLAHTLERGRREGAPVAFALLDLDHFKRVNDRFGHAAGDAALRAFAQAVKSRLRSSDVLGRMGGEEFGLILPMTDGPGAARIVEQVRDAVEAMEVRSPESGETFRVTVSAGVVVAASDSGLTASRLYMLADKELYRAKELGRNRVQLGNAPPKVLMPAGLAGVAGAGEG